MSETEQNSTTPNFTIVNEEMADPIKIEIVSQLTKRKANLRSDMSDVIEIKKITLPYRSKYLSNLTPLQTGPYLSILQLMI